MTRALLMIAVDGMTVDPLGVKEAVSMALEPLGGWEVGRRGWYCPKCRKRKEKGVLGREVAP